MPGLIHFTGPVARLIAEHLAVRQCQPLQNALPRALDVLQIRIAAVDELLRQTVRTEEQHDSIAYAGSNCSNARRTVSAMASRYRGSSGYDEMRLTVKRFRHSGMSRCALQLLLRRPGRRARVMRKERERDDALDAVRRHGFQGVCGCRRPIAHRDIRLDRRACLIEPRLERRGLRTRQSQLGRAAADAAVVLPH